MSSEQSKEYFYEFHKLICSNSKQSDNASSNQQDLSYMPKYLSETPWFLPKNEVALSLVFLS